MKYNDNERALIWFNQAQGINANKRIELLDNFQNAAELYRDFKAERKLIESVIGPSGYEKLLALHDDKLIDKIIDEFSRRQIVALTLDSEDYPHRLKPLSDAPLCLYCLGNIELLSDERIMAIVGTRHISRYGKDACSMFARELCANGFTIVSGLARGADTIAHKAALDNEARTIAVLGNGLDHVYPSENIDMYKRIAQSGLIVTEYPLGTQPFGYNFPPRNRIISGLSEGVLVIEAGDKSGTMITVDFALEQGKDVFALPGNIFSEQSYGTNELIKTSSAEMVTNINDILAHYNIKARQLNVSQIQLDFIEQSIVKEIEGSDIHFEELLVKSGLEFNALMTILTNLEVYGIIRKLPGNYYSKVKGV